MKASKLFIKLLSRLPIKRFAMIADLRSIIYLYAGIYDLPSSMRLDHYSNVYPTVYPNATKCKKFNEIHLLDILKMDTTASVKFLLRFFTRQPIPELFRKLFWLTLSKSPLPEAIQLLREITSDFVKMDGSGWSNLSKNPGAVQIIKTYPYKMKLCDLALNPSPEIFEIIVNNIHFLEGDDWASLSKSPFPEAFQLLKNNAHHLTERCWEKLSINPSPQAVQVLRENAHLLNEKCWYSLSDSKVLPEVIQLLRENPEKVDFCGVSEHESPEIIQLYRENIESDIDWGCVASIPYAAELCMENINRLYYNNRITSGLSANPSPIAIQFLKNNPDSIDFVGLACNESPEALDLLRDNIQSLNDILWGWHALSTNPSPEAIKILRENIDYVRWDGLAKNTSIDAYYLMKENMDKFDQDCIPVLLRNESYYVKQLCLDNIDHIKKFTQKNILEALIK